MSVDLHELVKNTVDMHVHCVPDASLKHRQTRSNKQMIEECRQAGMHGFVLKTHAWPNIGLAKELDSQYDDFRVYSSATLNTFSGGPYPWVAEIAAGLGVEVLWLPTWTSTNEHKNGGFVDLIEVDDLRKKMETQGMSDPFVPIRDESGKLMDYIKGVVDVCKEHDIVLCTGHIDSDDSLAVANYAHEVGYKKLCITHPFHPACYSSKERMKEMAELGAHLELCASTVGPMYGCTTIEATVETIKFVGVEHFYSGTDHFWDWEPSLPESLYQYFGCLYDAGLTYEELVSISTHWKQLLRE